MGDALQGDRSGRPVGTGRWRRVAGVATLVLVGNVLPGPPRLDGGFDPHGVDKLLHLLSHAALASVLVDAVAGNDADGTGGTDGADRRRATTLAVATSIGYGAILEGLQRAIPGRNAEASDLLAATVGSVAGAIVATRSRR